MSLLCISLLLLAIAAAFATASSSYHVTVYTADERYAGTSSNIKIRMYGTKGISDVIPFQAKRSNFARGSVDKFVINLNTDIGEIFSISVGHDESGWWSGWKLDKVEIQKSDSQKIIEFPVNKWLETDSGRNSYVSVTRRSTGNCGTVTQSRVVNGEDAKKGQWPWQAQLTMYGGSHHCGGTLIHPQYVLTASHCIDSIVDRPESLTVVLGQHNLSVNESSEQKFGVERIIRHPDYHRETIDNDIALLKLNGGAMLTPHVNLACLPKQDEHVASGNQCFVTGWGRLYGGGHIPTKLQQAILPTVSNQNCANTMKYSKISITKNMLCAGGNRKSGCHGDSGGPFVCQKQDGTFTVQGAVSWGSPKCVVQSSYTVFARVGKYVDWIESHVNSQYIKESEM